MNFQFTGKIKRNLFILIAIGVVLFLFGFFNEKSHLYVTEYTDEGVEFFKQYNASPEDASKALKRAYHAAKNEKGATNMLVEFHHHMPFTVEEFMDSVKTAAGNHGLAVNFENLAELHGGHGDKTHGEEAHAEGHEGETEAKEEHHGSHDLMLLITPSELEVPGSHHHEEHGEGHGEEHGDGHAEEAHGDGHGAAPVHHTPMEILSHIIHDQGQFKDAGHARTWSNLLVNGFFFFGIALGALFFIALQYATESGWGVVWKRLLEAMTGWLPVGAVILTFVFIAASSGWNHIYHWMQDGIMTPGHENFDEIIYHKQPFLTQWFFWLMNIVFFAVFLLFARGFRKRSLREDEEGGTKIHMKNFAKGALYLVLFGYLSSVMSWFWIMSIDTHWFSTLFGWFVFSGIWISATIFVLLLVFWLKGLGYMEFVNDSHIHDMGKWMFAISFLWTYLFFSQFMLIWYANIPEEVTYYLDRFANYKWILWTTVAVNFVIPIILLMSRESKRSRNTIMIIGSILFVFHWIDVFIMVMPGSVFDHWSLGALEIGMFLAFLGLFIYVVLKTLAKAPLLVKKHPYLDENMHQHT